MKDDVNKYKCGNYEVCPNLPVKIRIGHKLCQSCRRFVKKENHIVHCLKKEPDIVEVFHSKLLEVFSLYRDFNGGELSIAIDGGIFNEIIVIAKNSMGE